MNMSDKTSLERDIERNERFRVPFRMYILVVLLLISVGAAGVYSLNLQKVLMGKDKEIVLIKEKFRKEKVELLGKIKQLEKEQHRSK